MTASVPDKDLRKLLTRYPQFEVTRTKRHLRIRHPGTGDFVIAPSTGSDWRGLRNLERDLRHLSTGRGYNQRAAMRV
ncbi:hypothetical protein PPH41_01965 [Burkholderia gladioli]|nr:hypothetical protein [Burkholderia gladioli]